MGSHSRTVAVLKVLIANNMAPFIWGGAEELAAHLSRNLVEAGHEAEIVRIPFQWEPASQIPSQMMLVRALELRNVDRVIALKFPAYLIQHDCKVLWLLHQYRQAYDLFDAGQSNIGHDADGDRLRHYIKTADNTAFGESTAIFTNSEVTRERLRKYNGFDAEVLLPPVNDPWRFCGAPAEGYVFAGGRVNSAKRQHLLVEAAADAGREVRLVIAGPPDTQADVDRLEALVEHHGLQDRVKLDLRFLARSEYADYVNRSAAVAYLPFDEDSLGYVAMEAATAGKPIITAVDSGGILYLCRDGVSGWVADPNPAALAAAMSQALSKTGPVSALGHAAKEIWTGMKIDWPNTLEALLR